MAIKPFLFSGVEAGPTKPAKPSGGGIKPFAFAGVEGFPDEDASEEKPNPGVPGVGERLRQLVTRPNQSLIQTVTGKSVEKYLEENGLPEFVKSVVPKDAQQTKSGDYTARFLAELSKAPGGVLDFATSPTGLAIMGLHLAPQTRFVAMGVDYAMAAYQGVGTLSDLSAFAKDRSPENLARAVTSLAFMYGALKGAKATRDRVYHGETPRAKVKEVRAILEQPTPEKVAANVRPLYRTGPPKTRAEVARMALGEGEVAAKAQPLQDALHEALPPERRARIVERMENAEDASGRRRAFWSGLKEELEAERQARLKAVVPDTATERRRIQIYQTPIFRNIAALVGVPKPLLLEVGADLIFDRSVLLNRRNYEVNRAINEAKKAIRPEMQTVRTMGYVLEKSATPEEVGMTPKESEAVKDIRRLLDENSAFIREYYGNKLSKVNRSGEPYEALHDDATYLTHIWKFTKDPPGEGQGRAARLLMKDPYLQKRKVATYKDVLDGTDEVARKYREEYGMEPKYDNVLDIVKIRSDYAAKAIANLRMANVLRDMGAVLSEAEYNKMRRSAPNSMGGEWQRMDNAPALYRATYGGTEPVAVNARGKVVRGDVTLRHQAPRVHPDIAMAAEAVFGKQTNFPGFAAIESVRSFGKKIGLSFSMFHPWALTEQAHAIYGTRAPSKLAGATYIFNADMYKGLATGLWEVRGKRGPYDPPVLRAAPELIRDGIDHGLNLATALDAESAVTKTMREAGQGPGRVLKEGWLRKALWAPIRKAGDISHIWDRSLWDFYHQGQMINAYEWIKNAEMEKIAKEFRAKGKSGTPEEHAAVTERKRAIAEHVNNAFGAINFERLLQSPHAMTALNFTFLAPAWTVSNFRVFSQAFENEAGSRLASRYAVGAAISWFLTTQMFNWAMTSWFKTKDKDGNQRPHFTWDNAGIPMMIAGKPVRGLTENFNKIHAGFNADGTQRMIKLGKGFQEPFSAMMDPVSFVGNKVSLPLRQLFVQATGHEPGSGYAKIDLSGTPKEIAERRLSALSELIFPFTARDIREKTLHAMDPETFQAPVSDTSWYSLPAGRGLSMTKAVQAYEEAKDAGDYGRMRAILSAAQANHLSVKKLLTAVRQRFRKRKTTEQGPRMQYDAYGNIVAAGPPAKR